MTNSRLWRGISKWLAMAAESFGEPGISSTSKPKKPAVAGQGLFDLTFEKDSAGPVADRSVSDIWPVRVDKVVGMLYLESGRQYLSLSYNT